MLLLDTNIANKQRVSKPHIKVIWSKSKVTNKKKNIFSVPCEEETRRKPYLAQRLIMTRRCILILNHAHLPKVNGKHLSFDWRDKSVHIDCYDQAVWHDLKPKSSYRQGQCHQDTKLKTFAMCCNFVM